MGYQRFHPHSSGLGHFLAGLGVGVLVGAVLGVLSAPHRGEVTRRKIARQAGAARDQVVEAVEDLVERRAAREDGDNGSA